MITEERDNLVASHLKAALYQLEDDARQGRYSTLCTRALGNIAHALGYQDFANRAVDLLRAAPDEAFSAGAITNFPLPRTVPDRLRSLATAQDLVALYPPFSGEEVVQYICSLATNKQHLRICLGGRFDDARQVAGSGLKLEETGSALAVLGEFEAARRVASDPALESFRQRGVRLVLVIELFRHGLSDEARFLLTELEQQGLSTWDRIHIAAGIAGRLPWHGYPFPDW